MATHRPKLLAATVSAVLVLGAHAASALTYTCTSVNRQDFLDPAGDRGKDQFERRRRLRRTDARQIPQDLSASERGRGQRDC